MEPTVCLHCNAALTPADLSAGWCDSCGKRLPTGAKPVKAAKAAIPAAPAAQDVGAPTAWPVIMVLAVTFLAIGGLAAIAFAR